MIERLAREREYRQLQETIRYKRAHRERVLDLLGHDRFDIERRDPVKRETVKQFIALADNVCLEEVFDPGSPSKVLLKRPDGRSLVAVTHEYNHAGTSDERGPDHIEASRAGVYTFITDSEIRKPSGMPFGTYDVSYNLFVEPQFESARIEKTIETNRVLGRYATASIVTNATDTEVHGAISVLASAMRHTDELRGVVNPNDAH